MILAFYQPESIYHPAEYLLPSGFKFPKAYLEYINHKEVVDFFPWSLMCHIEDTSYYDSWIGILKKQYPNRQLVPFAKWGLSDDIACFEPSDNPELPGVHYIHSFTDPGYEERGQCATFEEWLADAMKDALEYQTENPDYAGDDED